MDGWINGWMDGVGERSGRVFSAQFAFALVGCVAVCAVCGCVCGTGVWRAGVVCVVEHNFCLPFASQRSTSNTPGRNRLSPVRPRALRLSPAHTYSHPLPHNDGTHPAPGGGRGRSPGGGGGPRGVHWFDARRVGAHNEREEDKTAHAGVRHVPAFGKPGL